MEKIELQKQAQEMYENRKTYLVISESLNIPIGTLKSWRKRYSWQRATIGVQPSNATIKKTQKTKKVAPKKKKVAQKVASTKKASHQCLAQEKEYKKIKDNLLQQLKKNGTYTDRYIDLVNDYMALWRIKNRLIDDIESRGLQVKTFNSKGQEISKKNDSVTDLPKYNSQMLKLLTDLGLSVMDCDDGGGDDEDDV